MRKDTRGQNCPMIEEILEVLGYTNEQKVRYVTFKMSGDAKRWWLSMKLLDEQRYFPLSIREEKIEEFTNLTQGNMTVGEYAAKFVELSRFAPFLIPNEARKIRKFEKGPRRRIYKLVVGFQVHSDLVYKASMLEKNIQGSTESTEQKKRPAPSSFQT
ncbi:uncharacterized protein LOC131166487 [Malania oleifera]|uniref:uncharacterized protein LOC131166487 n=1 Tax=Malania oleifera TaxID=397392 RepID=UPI0025ADAAAA|nr:uncharacterized protein LOC131166487 [Malania oleifera]